MGQTTRIVRPDNHIALVVTPRRPSRTAILTAVGRAIHREEPPPWILDDALAAELAGDEGSSLKQRLRTDLSPAQLLGFSRWVCVRARLPEDILERAVPHGVAQYVILGAGLDSFAYRRADLLAKVHVFEVDQPASQAWKRQRLDELGVIAPPNLTFAAIDFERQALREGLVASGFDFGAPAIFSWIGVTMYLTLDAIRTTLGTIATCAPGTQVVLTYNLPSEALQGMAAELEGAIRGIATESGEPFISLFRPDQIERLLIESGFTGVTHFGPEEAVRTYFPGRDDVRIAGPQRLAIASVPG